MGRIAISTLPVLVLGLRRDGFQGWLRLSRAGSRRDFQFVAGSLMRVESNDPGDALAPILLQLGCLDEAEGQKVADAVASGTAEIRAIASLRKVAPKDLLAAFCEQGRRAMISSLGWPDGEFTLEPDGQGADATRGAIDVLPLVLDAVARRLEPHQVLEILGDKAMAFPSLPESEELRAAIPEHPWIAALCDDLDGRTAPFHLLRSASAAQTAAALIALDNSGLLVWSQEPSATDDEPGTAEAEAGAQSAAPEMAGGDPLLSGLEIEVVDAPSAPVVSPTGHTPAAARERNDEAERLVAEVMDLHSRLGEIDHYTLLGIETDAKPAAIRRAYLKLAKRLHPDAVARIGVDEIGDEANAVFARISEAHETLGSADERERYDALLRGEEEIDYEKVAQAETLFQKGDMLLRAGNFLGALEFLEAAAELYPIEADYQGGFGWCLFKKNPPEAEKAQLHLSEAARLAPDTALWPFRLHYVLRHLGDEAGATEALSRARRIDPNVASL